MLKDCSVFVLMNNKDAEVKRIVLPKNTQNQITSAFSSSLQSFLSFSAKPMIFNLNNKSQSSQLFCIPNYHVPQTILEAINTPNQIDILKLDEGNLPKIKNIFVGTITPKPTIAFQNFTITQYLSRKGWSLFHSEGSFSHSIGIGLGIDDRIDCVYHEGTLLFSSFWTARQTLDLSKYYKEATETDIAAFTDHSSLHFISKEDFCKSADSWMRRKIASLSDANVLDKHSVANIASQANKHGIDIKTEEVAGNQRIVMPDDKEQVKTLLHFLDDDIYIGPLTENIYISNSKKPLNND